MIFIGLDHIIDDFNEGGAASAVVAQSPVFGTQFKVKWGYHERLSHHLIVSP